LSKSIEIKSERNSRGKKASVYQKRKKKRRIHTKKKARKDKGGERKGTPNESDGRNGTRESKSPPEKMNLPIHMIHDGKSAGSNALEKAESKKTFGKRTLQAAKTSGEGKKFPHLQ